MMSVFEVGDDSKSFLNARSAMPYCSCCILRALCFWFGSLSDRKPALVTSIADITAALELFRVLDDGLDESADWTVFSPVTTPKMVRKLALFCGSGEQAEGLACCELVCFWELYPTQTLFDLEHLEHVG
jgi:hypothetical protein